jgi:F420-dependent oxidoreductase-like protein
MRLALSIGHLRGAEDRLRLDAVRRAEALGFAAAWVGEAYGSDAATVLAYLAGRTTTIELGSAVMQLPGRTPAMTAMTAATLDILSAGRALLGLGVSGPQVSEGWHGVDFAEPLARTREYVEIVRAVLRRDPLRYSGAHYTLPKGGAKAIKLSMHPVRERLPVYLASIGPRNLRLTGEIADGWLGMLLSAEHAGEQLGQLAVGRAAAGLDMRGFDVVATVPVLFGDDVSACADQVRAYAARYLGGMGSRQENFYNALAVRMGYVDAARVIQELYLSGQPDAAAAAVPEKFIDQISLLGPVSRVADRLKAYAGAGVTTLAMLDVSSADPTVAAGQLADAYARSGLG